MRLLLDTHSFLWFISGMAKAKIGAIQKALEEKLARLKHCRLAREYAKLDPEFEKAMAEEGISAEQSHYRCRLF